MEHEHHQAADDQRDDGDYLDEREPELELAEHAYREQVRAVEREQRDERGQPLRHGGQPPAHVDADGGELGHRRRDPREPVGPAGHEPRERAAELVGIGGEGAGHRAVGEELTESSHDEEDGDAPERIGEHEGGTGVVDRPGGAEEQPDADRSADRDELDVPAAKPAREIGPWLRHEYSPVSLKAAATAARAARTAAPAATRSVARARRRRMP